MAGRNPPPFLNTEDDRGAIVAVVSFTTIAVSTFTNGIRLINRQQSEASLGLDDVLLVAANVSTATERCLLTLLTSPCSADHSYCTDRLSQCKYQ